MKGILSKILIAGTLLSGGIASADTFRSADSARDHREVPVQVARRDNDRMPPPRVEHYRERRGYTWIGGSWKREHGRWSWNAGRYERIRGGR